MLNSLGALTRRAVDCFVLDVLIEAPSSSSASSDGKAKDQPTAPQQRQQQSPPRSPRPVAAGKKCKGKAPAATTPAAATAASGGSSSPLPILLLLHGPSRFLRGRLAQDEAPKLEAGTHMKQRILQQLSGRRFKQVASVDVWEWARERTREARIDLLRAKIGGRLLDAYLTPPPAAAPSSQAVGNCTLAAP